MCPRTSWSLSSFTLNMVLGRASWTSPSISIFSSFPTGESLLPLEILKLAGALGQKRFDRALQVLGLEQVRKDARRDLVRVVDAAVEVSPDDLLGLRVGDG